MTGTNQEMMVIETKVAPIAKQAVAMVIKTQDDRIKAVTFRKLVKAFRDDIEKEFHPTKNKIVAYQAYKEASDTEGKFYDPLDMADEMVKQKIKAYDTAEALNAQRIAAQAEAERLDKERIEREKLITKAMKAEEQGKTEKAEALREQAESVSVAPTFTPPTNGKKLIWKCEVTNIMLLCKAIIDGQVPYNVIEVRQSVLNDFAKSHDGKTKIDGLRFWQETSRI